MSQVRRRQFLTAAAALLAAPQIIRAQAQKALGLKVPQSILLRADKVIE